MKIKFQNSELLAYFLGIFLGDGCVHMDKKSGNYRVLLFVGEKDQIVDKWKNVTDQLGMKSNIYRPKNRRMFVIQMYSKKLCNWLKSLTIKSIDIKLNSNVSKKSFLNGIFDSEGWVTKDFNLGIGNTNYELIKLCCKLFKELNYHQIWARRLSALADRGIAHPPFLTFQLNMIYLYYYENYN